MEPWIKKTLKDIEKKNIDAEAEAYFRIEKERGDEIVTHAAYTSGMKEMNDLAKLMLDHGLAETFSLFINYVGMGFFAEGYKAGKEAVL